MELTLKNIGKIGQACIKIDGITVIAGANDTGKSTVSRALFAVFNSFCGWEGQVAEERIRSIGALIDRMGLAGRVGYWEQKNEIASRFVADRGKYKDDREGVKNEIEAFAFGNGKVRKEGGTAYFSVLQSGKIASEIVERLKIPEKKMLREMFGRRLKAEFWGQINNTVPNQIKSEKVQESPAREGIAKHFLGRAGQELVRFDLGKYEKLYFRKVHTYTEKEVEGYLEQNGLA